MHHIPVLLAAAFLFCMMFLIGVISVTLYFVPSIVAHVRKTRYRWLITIGNLLFGISVIGWFIFLAAAWMDKKVPSGEATSLPNSF